MQRRRVGVLIFDGIQALDVFGPADAFASDAFRREDGEFGPAGPYEIVLIALGGRTVRSSSGAMLRADVQAGAKRPAQLKLDTLMIPGGAGLRRAGAAERAAAWILDVAPHVRRVASVCTGIYGLAPTGLLDGRRVTTHWSAVTEIGRRFPKLVLDGDAIYVKDGPFYTSAGVTAGIDLALALIEEDLGGAWALAVARELVVYLKRPGGQQQFSEPLRFQIETSDRFRDLASWIGRHLDSDLSVRKLAARCHLSPRQFARVFKQEFGVTPRMFVEETRLSEASRRLPARRVAVERIARSVGYAGDDVFRRAFERRFGMSPTAYRRAFDATGSYRKLKLASGSHPSVVGCL
ncbi:MAG: DJ-1/PfpI family protein [Gemmatimonadaceae bacterium]|nr:DJ-1/PfpI family protein [Gemmatimonadaceae bacterium]